MLSSPARFCRRTVAGVLPQDETRRRIRAAMALAGVGSWEDLADRTPFSRSLLKDLGTERAEVGEQHLRPIAAACGVPYAWFTIPDLKAAVASGEDETLAEHVEALERRVAVSLTELRAGLAAVSADSVRHTRELRELRDMGRRLGHPVEGD